MLSPSQKLVPQRVNSSQCSRKNPEQQAENSAKGRSHASWVAGRWAGRQTLTRRNKRKLEEGWGVGSNFLFRKQLP